jgi:hypothetical protein
MSINNITLTADHIAKQQDGPSGHVLRVVASPFVATVSRERCCHLPTEETAVIPSNQTTSNSTNNLDPVRTSKVLLSSPSCYSAAS